MDSTFFPPSLRRSCNSGEATPSFRSNRSIETEQAWKQSAERVLVKPPVGLASSIIIHGASPNPTIASSSKGVAKGSEAICTIEAQKNKSFQPLQPLQIVKKNIQFCISQGFLFRFIKNVGQIHFFFDHFHISNHSSTTRLTPILR